MFVLDASVALAWVLLDEQNDRATSALEALRTDTAVVPAHWPMEVLNGLVTGERRKRIAFNDAITAITTLGQLPIEVVPYALFSDGPPIFGRAFNLSLSAYDAAYLDLALARSVPLATLDDRLVDAAHKVGVVIIAA